LQFGKKPSCSRRSADPTMFARIAALRALIRKAEKVFNPDRKGHHWGRRKLKGDQ
jgi:hypothetical protein